MLKRLNYGIGAAVLFAAALLLTSTNVAFTGEQEEFQERYEAFAVAMGTSNPPVIPRGRSISVQIGVNRWTTEEERESLFTELKENGQEGLVRALQRQSETGWIRPRPRGSTRNLRQTLRYARQIDLGDGNRRLVLGLDRPITFWESTRRPRWSDHDMTLIIMDLDENSEGEGQLAMGVQVELNEETAELAVETFGSEPVRLNQIRKQ